MDTVNQSLKKEFILLKVARLLFFMRFAMFAGSIGCTIVMNTVVDKQPSTVLFYYERIFVTPIVYTLTIPGMWMMAVTGLFIMLKNNYGFFKKTSLGIIQVLSILILINGTFLLTPMVKKIISLAAEGMQREDILPQFMALKSKEDIFGAINFILFIVCLLLYIFKPFTNKQ